MAIIEVDSDSDEFSLYPTLPCASNPIDIVQVQQLGGVYNRQEVIIPVDASPNPRQETPSLPFAGTTVESSSSQPQRPPSVPGAKFHDPYAEALHLLGIQYLHPWQRKVLDSWRCRRDVLVLSGTGSGKSLVFQVPALQSYGAVVIVVSPLISLMRDQVASMQTRGIPATFLGSAQEDSSMEQRVLAGDFRLVYSCPETLQRLSHGFLTSLYLQERLCLFAIDEAHCISKWGHDFRHSYLQLGHLRHRFPKVPLMALTATATSRVRTEMVLSLGLRDPYICVNSFYRTNLAYSVRHSTCFRQDWEEDLGPFFPPMRRATSCGVPQEPCTLVYTPSRKEAEGIAAWLVRRGVNAAPYHAKLPRAHLDSVHSRFLKGSLPCVVATIAFGMGINKADVRRVLHYGYPQSLEALHQETGRAGRDGRPSVCILFANLQKPPRLLPAKRDHATTQACLEMLRCMYAYAIRESGCRAHVMLEYFGEDKGSSWRCGACDLCKTATANLATTDLSTDCFTLMQAMQQASRLRCALDCSKMRLDCIVGALIGQSKEGPGSEGEIGVEYLPCFGAGSARPTRFWLGLVAMLMKAGLLQAGENCDVAGGSGAPEHAALTLCPELTELGRVACGSLERGERVPLVASLKPIGDVAMVLEDERAKVAGVGLRGVSSAQVAITSKGFGKGRRRAKASRKTSRFQKLSASTTAVTDAGVRSRAPVKQARRKLKIERGATCQRRVAPMRAAEKLVQSRCATRRAGKFQRF